ncbi:MAG: hypothetical protein IJU95_05995 [Treponema sp.]|nr:hypothetical protein [Treponema sp.]
MADAKALYPKVDFLYLSEDDMIAAGVKDMAGCGLPAAGAAYAAGNSVRR